MTIEAMHHSPSDGQDPPPLRDYPQRLITRRTFGQNVDHIMSNRENAPRHLPLALIFNSRRPPG
ncbi:MAG: hypothetical protein ACKVT0_11925 [Planctomycetaceae bacterium]